MSELRINTAGQIPQQSSTVAQQTKKEKSTPSIFTYSDKNNNGVVDAEDFNNNETVVSIVKKNGWLGKTWEKCSEGLNKLLQHTSIDNTEQSFEKVYTQMVANVDKTNHSEVVATLTALRNANTSRNGEQLTYEQSEKLTNQLFNSNVISSETYRDGGSREWTLEDGSSIYQDFGIGSSTYGQVTWHNPDGTVEYYSDEGKQIKK